MTVEELLFVYLHNANPAVDQLLDLVDDEPLEPTAYKNLITALDSFFTQLAKDNPEIQGSRVPVRNSARARRSVSVFARRSAAIYTRQVGSPAG